MTWLKLTDEVVDAPMTLRLWTQDPGAFGLDVRGQAYCAKHLTDGALPREAVEAWFRDAGELDRLTGILVDVGRWQLRSAGTVDDGYFLPHYLDDNPSREKVLAERARKSKAGRKGGKRSGQSRRAG